MVAAHGGAIDMDILNSMDQLHLNIQEALRMNPPLVMLMRMSKEPFAVTTSDGRHYVVPKGHIVATSPTFRCGCGREGAVGWGRGLWGGGGGCALGALPTGCAGTCWCDPA